METPIGDRKHYKTECSQSPVELAGLIDVARRENVTRFLEVGSRYGGSLWKIAHALPLGSLVISVDSGKGMGGHKAGALSSLAACILALRADGYNAHHILGDSQLPEIVHKVLAFAPFDMAFLDGDHELAGVTRDWENYGAVSRIVAFHDVAWRIPAGYIQSKKVEVPDLWRDLRETHRHVEFIDPAFNYGIGVLWRQAA